MRCALYLYTPDSETVQDGEKQTKALKQFAFRHQWEVSKIYSDRGSTKSSTRANYDRMLGDAAKRYFDVLLFWSLDRLSQAGTLPTLRLLNDLTSWNIRYCSFTEQHFNTSGAHRQIVLGVLSTILHQQSLHISHRTRKGLERQKITGKPGPHGRRGPGQPPVEFDQAKARKLREVEGRSYLDIANICGVSKATIYRYLTSQEKLPVRNQSSRSKLRVAS